MIDTITAALPLVLIALIVYCVGALIGAWTFFGVPVSFRP
jgi:hypothetical protein